MTETTAATELREPPRLSDATPGRAQLGRVGDFVLRSILPLVLALVAGAVVLVAIGVDPIQYYKDVWSGGVQFAAWQDSLMRVAPLLLIAVGLIVAFRAGIWNLGMDGQFLLARQFAYQTWAKEIGPDGRPAVLPGTDPTPEGTYICPSIDGATNWMSPSYSPQTGLFYVAAREERQTYFSAPQPSSSL